jgi:hypothetical protein
LAAVLPASAAPPSRSAAGSAFLSARGPRRAQRAGAIFQFEIAGSSLCAV